MAVSNNKLKMLYVLKALMEKSDEEHVMSASDLETVLKEYGLSSDRKTIYSDIETLTEYGIDIEKVVGGVKAGYYIASRNFELPELKLLVDAVQSSKFITSKKSDELIKKIETLTNEHNAKLLQREVYIYNRIKTGNEKIYYSVDAIHGAILNNCQIEFKYNEWNLNKELVPKKKGKKYCVSPWALTWDDENYYLIAYEESSDKIKHYRVDKMTGVVESDEQRLGKEKFEDFDLAVFSKKTFGMYGGEDSKVSLLCHKSLIGVIIDRFGKDVIIVPAEDDKFVVNVLVSVSPQFFGWITGLGSGITINGPEPIRQKYREFLEGILNKY